jgi:hypothetical protein
MLQLSNLDLPSETGTQSNPTPYKYGYTTGGGPDTVLHGQLPFLNTIAYMTNGQYSNYNGMELIYNRRFANGLNFNTNYNWGHALNNACGAGSACTFISTEPANFEYGGLTAQRVAGSLGYEIPLGKNFHGIAGGIVKGWKVNAIGYWQTGGALTVTMGSRLGISGVGNARPNVVAPTKLSHPTLSEWFNTAAFALPDYGVYGTERVNQVRAPNSRNVDLSVNKRFPIYESLKLEFRAECFNLGNFANYGNPGVNMAASNFGKISSVSNESRQFQFALKLLF